MFKIRFSSIMSFKNDKKKELKINSRELKCVLECQVCLNRWPFCFECHESSFLFDSRVKGGQNG